jgi:hypothetical protein
VTQASPKLRPGDLVEVKSPQEIWPTLDHEGALDQLPFMPEMLECCGKRYRVSRRALTVCYSGAGSPRGFRNDDVVTLDGIRCSGSDHDGCQKACMIFWKESWLRKVEDAQPLSEQSLKDRATLHSHLKTSTGPKTYFCQASELANATHALLREERFARYLNGLFSGNFNLLQMLHSVQIWLVWKIRTMLLGIYARGTATSTPAEGLDLQPGEWVEVKSMESIRETLNERGQNRGLYFSPDMRLLCGKRLRVRNRIDKLIVDGTGEQRRLRNTVCLEGSTCGCDYLGFGMGGCSRAEVSYWREVWLRRVDDGSGSDFAAKTGSR